MRHQRPRLPVFEDLQRSLIAFRESGDRLLNAIFQNPKLRVFQAVDVFALGVGNGEAEHHHVHFDPKSGRLLAKSQITTRARQHHRGG